MLFYGINQHITAAIFIHSAEKASMQMQYAKNGSAPRKAQSS